MNQYILIQLNAEYYAVHVDQIATISDYANVTTLPNGPAYVDGLLNLRGTIIPVVNLKKRFGLPQTAGASKRILVAELDGAQVGFLVDDASKSISVEPEAILPPPPIALQKRNAFIKEVCIHKEALVLVVDLARVLSSRELEDIAELE